MILDKGIYNESTYLYMERYINDGSPSGFSDITSSHPTKAKSSNRHFHIIGLSFSDKVIIQDYGNKPDFIDEWQMLAHPDMIYRPENNALLKECTKFELTAILVSPTSSIRTVKMLDKNGWFIKLHYDGLIGRIVRKLERNHAVSAVEVSKIIEKAIDAQKLPKKFFIQREPFARIINLQDEKQKLYEWGMVLREPFTYPFNDKVKSLIPAFSLFSEDPKNTNHKSILTQLIAKQTKCVEDFLFEDLIAPVFESYFELLLKCGLQLECHAQNTLFGIDENFGIVGIVAKDMESIDKDISLMGDLNISQNIEIMNYKCLLKDDYNYQKMHSFMFDFKLGEYLISPIIDDVIKNFPTFNANSLIDKIKEFNKIYLAKLPKDFLPANKWYSDKKEIRDRSEKKKYIENPNPKYR
ncbi:MAG: hypothetical protein GQ564_04050 [Bacteroidales bacterium]|nr:hypothetical protein [Bacteroidales bacterium]